MLLTVLAVEKPGAKMKERSSLSVMPASGAIIPFWTAFFRTASLSIPAPSSWTWMTT